MSLDLMMHSRFQYDYVEDPLNADVDLETLVDKRVLIDKLEIMTGTSKITRKMSITMSRVQADTCGKTIVLRIWHGRATRSRHQIY
jgi:hypothetical protein